MHVAGGFLASGGRWLHAHCRSGKKGCNCVGHGMKAVGYGNATGAAGGMGELFLMC